MKKSIVLNGVWLALLLAMIVVWFVPLPFKASVLVLCGLTAAILGRFA